MDDPPRKRPTSLHIPMAEVVDPNERRRRKSRDPVSRAFHTMAFAAWILFFAALGILGIALPIQRENMFTRIVGFSFNDQVVDRGMLRVAFVLVMINTAICLVGLRLNAMRMKRPYDRWNRSLISFGVLSLLGSIALALNW